MVIPLKSKAFLLFLLLLVLTPIAHADYRDPYLEISKGNVPGHFAIHKYGHNLELATTFETIWDGSDVYTYPTVATLMNLTSTDVDDTNDGAGAWNVTIYGLDANYDQINETVLLNGQTPTPTTLQYLRVYRMYIRRVGATGVNEGIIYLGTGATVAGVPANIYAMIEVGYGQTMMTQYTVPDGYTAYISNFIVTCTANKNFVTHLIVREYNEGWRVLEESSLAGGGYAHITYDPQRIIPERSDIEFQGLVDVVTGSTEINYDLILVKDGYELISDTGGLNVLWLPIIIMGVLVLALAGRRR